jgi:DNA-binding transcriptional ArsR family regulator
VPTGEYTLADEELVADVWAAHHVQVSPRQLQTYRRRGLITADVEYLGRKGTRTTYPPEAVDAVARVARVKRQTGSLDLTALCLFGVGVNPTEKALTGAYRWFLDQTEQRALAALGRQHTPAFNDDLRHQLAHLKRHAPELLDAWNAQAKATAHIESQTGGPWGNSPPITSRDVRERDVEELLTAMQDPDRADIEPFLRDVVGATPHDLDNLHAVGGPSSIADRRRALQHTSYDELLELRDTVRANRDEALSVLPATLRPYAQTQWDEPLTMGLNIASVVLDVAAISHRGHPPPNHDST